jgi:signal transduction histidine kinase
MLTAYLKNQTPPGMPWDSEALFRILENLPVALGVAEPVLPDGTIRPDAAVTYYNKKWRDLFGFGTDEVKNVTQATERLYPDPEMRRRNIAWREGAAARAKETGRAVSAVELVAMGAEGRWIHVLSSTTMVGDKMLVSMEDITARKRAEEALELALANEARLRAEAEAAREAAERADKAKSLFLASMSHEVRTPLTSLIALARVFCLESTKLKLPESFADLLEQIQSGGEYLNLILTNLLEVSAQEAGKSRVVAEEFFVADWLSDIGNILGPVASANGVKLELHGPRNGEARFRTDPMRLSQILLNLGHNAVKFSGGGGRTVRVGVSLRSGKLGLVVCDEGPGIDPERLPALFGEFEQSEMKGPRHDRGVGLGLAVVARNAELLGGTVSARNLESGGMEFTVSLPLLDSEGRPSGRRVRS